MAFVPADIPEFIAKLKTGFFFTIFFTIAAFLFAMLLEWGGMTFSTGLLDWVATFQSGELVGMMLLAFFAVIVVWLYILGWGINVVTGEEKIMGK